MTVNKDKSITLTKNTVITTSAAFLIMVGGALITATSWLLSVKTKAEANSSVIEELKTKSDRLEQENVNAKVEFSKIQTQLKNIEVNVLEIKERL